MNPYTPHYYQENAISSFFDFVTMQQGHPIIAMPTGTGKSIVIAEIIKRAMHRFPTTRVLGLTHVKELVGQNDVALRRQWSTVPSGIYSAGLRRRDTALPVIFGGVASVANNVELFGRRDLIIIDECHLLSQTGSSMYNRTIDKFRKLNPNLRILGLSATPYRMGQGLLTDDGLFTDFCTDITGHQAFNRLIAEGFLSPPFVQKTDVEIDTSLLSMAQGEFSQKELEAAAGRVTVKCLQEMCYRAADRQCWLLFSSGIDHAENCASILNSYGVPTAAVHSKMSGDERNKRLDALRSHKLRCVVNQNVLTTGFDFPPIDCIGMMRPTMSTGLWVQMIGRGTRPSPGKTGCLVLDFAGNTKRLGPVNDPIIPRKKGQGGGDAPVRVCPNCGIYNHASARRCIACGEEFSFSTAPILAVKPGKDEILRSDLPITEAIEVKRVFYSKGQKAGMPPYMLVNYSDGFNSFKEFVCLEHHGLPGKNARDWWRSRHFTEPPATVDEALTYQSALKVPRYIRVITNRKHPEVVGYEYD